MADQKPITRQKLQKYTRSGLYKSREIKCAHCGNPFTVNNPQRRFCTPVCGALHRVVPVETRFWRYVQKTESCWLWTGGSASGYGKLRGYKTQLLAPRFSYELHVGPVPNGLWVLHTCDNPPCVNPAHLFLGTAADNNADKARKGRASRFPGEAHPMARLSQTQAREIKSSGRDGRELARTYGVSPATICDIRKGRTWAHL